jgi:RHS repeat-associated protein
MNTTALVNASGSVVERYLYDPYGKVKVLNPDWSDDENGESDFGNEILYAGYRLDSETGLYHVRHRYYHATLGRWLSRDPAGYQDGMNLYEYCRSGPAGATDPSGLEESGQETMNQAGVQPAQSPCTGDPGDTWFERIKTWLVGRPQDLEAVKQAIGKPFRDPQTGYIKVIVDGSLFLRLSEREQRNYVHAGCRLATTETEQLEVLEKEAGLNPKRVIITRGAPLAPTWKMHVQVVLEPKQDNGATDPYQPAAGTTKWYVVPMGAIDPATGQAAVLGYAYCPSELHADRIEGIHPDIAAVAPAALTFAQCGLFNFAAIRTGQAALQQPIAPAEEPVPPYTARPKYGATPKGRPFTKHYGTQTGPQRNIPGSVVDTIIDTTEGARTEGGKVIYYDAINNVTVVTGKGGSIVSVHKGPP